MKKYKLIITTLLAFIYTHTNAHTKPENQILAQTWYSYKSGNWNDPSSWTLDGSVAPLFVNPSNEIPDEFDHVVITNGRTINVDVDDIEILGLEVVGRLDLLTSHGHEFTTIQGKGIIRMQGWDDDANPTTIQVDNFPSGNVGGANGFADREDGGTLELYGTGVLLDQTRTFKDVVLRMSSSTDEAVLRADYVINGDLLLNTGIFKINDNSTNASINIDIIGDYTIESAAEQRVGNADARHEINMNGDFINRGTAYFSQRNAQVVDSEASDGIVDANFVSGIKDQSINLFGPTYFYRMVCNKGVNDTYILNVQANTATDFVLTGPANSDNIGDVTNESQNLNALAPITGTLKLGSNITVNPLNNTGNYTIGSNARLLIDGATVVKTGGSALTPYGTLEVAAGQLIITSGSGVTLLSTGQFKISGGIATMPQFLTSILSDTEVGGGYEQSGGTVNIGPFNPDIDFPGLGLPTSSDNILTHYANFSLTSESNSFIMTGGTLNLNGASELTGVETNSGQQHGGLIFINSDPGNINVTGGTVTITTSTDRNHILTSRAPFYNFTINNTSSGTKAKVLVTGATSGATGLGNGVNNGGTVDDQWRTLSAQTLKVLNDLTINTGTTRTLGSNVFGTYLDFCSGAICADLEVGRNLTINDNTVIDFFSGNANNTNSSSVFLTGTSDAILTIGNITTYRDDLTEFDDPDVDGDSYEKWEQPFYILTIDKPGAILTFATTGTAYDAGATIDYTDGLGNKNINTTFSNLVKVVDEFSLENGSVDIDIYSIRLYGNITNKGILSLDSNPINAQVKIREEITPTTRIINTIDGAEFGNLRLNSGEAIVEFTSNVYIKRLLYKFGRINIGTHNLKIDNLVYGLNIDQVVGDDLSIEDMIIMDGNASDGGLSLYVGALNNPGIAGHADSDIQANPIGTFTDPRVYHFPIGTGTTGTYPESRYTPANIRLNTFYDDGYITVNVVDEQLQTTGPHPLGNDVLNRYWRVRYEGFDTPPLIDRYRFHATIADIPDGVNDTEMNGLSGNWKPGYVLDNTPFTRFAEENLTGSSRFNNSSSFDQDDNDPNETNEAIRILFFGETTGSGTGPSPFSLIEANYSAGLAAKFSGTPNIFYTRKTSHSATDQNTWHDPQTWSFDPIDESVTPPIQGAANTGGVIPGAGDVVVFQAHSVESSLPEADGSWTLNKLRLAVYGPTSTDTNLPTEVALAIFEEDPDGDGPRETARVFLREGSSHNWDEVRGSGEFQLFFGDQTEYPTFDNSNDLGDFLNNENSLWNINYQGTGSGQRGVANAVTASSFPSVFPNLRITANANSDHNGADGWGDQFIVTFSEDVTINEKMEIQNRAAFWVQSNMEIKGNLEIGVSFENGRFRFDNGNTPYTVSVAGNVIIGKADGDDEEDSYLDIQSEGTGSATHILKVDGNIQLQENTGDDQGRLNLRNIASDDSNVILELTGSTSGNFTFTNQHNIIPELYKVVMNKGADITSTFSFENDINLPLPSEISTQPIEILNGLLIFNNTDIMLTDATRGDFLLPNTGNIEASSGSGGLEVAAGTVRIEGDDTGILLDGILRISGGTFDMAPVTGNGNNFLEISSSGNAQLEISNGTLNIGGQLRRAISNTTGVLSFRQTGGTVNVATRNGSAESNRGIFEVMNLGSEFTHTGGALHFYNSNNSASVPSVLLEPSSSNITGSVITFSNTTGDTNMGIKSAIPLNRLELKGSGNSTVKIYELPLSLDSLTIDANNTFDANGFGLSFQGGSLLNNGTFISSGNNLNQQTTTFNSSSKQTISGNGISNFWRFTKQNTDSLYLVDKDITIQDDLRLEDGVFETDTNAVIVLGDVLNDTRHSSAAPTGAAPRPQFGIVMAGTEKQRLLRSSSGTSYFGTLSIENSNGVIIEDETFFTFQADGALVLREGVLDISSNLFIIGPDATIQNANGGSERDDFNVNNMVQTNSTFQDFGLRKIFNNGQITDFVWPVGQGAYTPVVLDMTAALSVSSSTGSITIRPSNEAHPTVNNHVNAGSNTPGEINDRLNTLQYHWIIKSEGITSLNADMEMSYDQGQVSFDNTGGTNPNVSFIETNYAAARLLFNSNTWEKSYDGVTVDENNNRIIFNSTDVFNGVDDLQITGDYTAGLLVADDGTTLLDVGAIPNAIPEFESVSNSGIYTNNSDWNGINGTPDLAGGEIPVGAIIYIRNGDEMSINSADSRIYRTVIEEGALLELTSNASNTRLGIVEGSGTIKLTNNNASQSISLPAGYYEDFFTCDGGKIEYSGSVDYEVLAGLVEVREVIFSGTGKREFSNTGITICENLILKDNVEIINTFGQDISVKGNLIKSDNAIATWEPLIVGSATLTLEGTNSQEIRGDFTESSNSAIYRLTINNNAGVTIVNSDETEIDAGGDIEITDKLTLTNGLVDTDVDNSLKVLADASIAGGGNFAYVNGPLVREIRNGSDNYFFPIGSASRYGRIDLEIPSGYTGTKDWTATYFNDRNPYDLFTMTANASSEGVEKASTFEYWNLEAISPASADIRPYWDSNSDVTDPEDLRVIYWDDLASAWEVLPEINAPSGSPVEGNLSAGPLSFSTKTVTFGTTNQNITLLPVEFLYFRGESRESGNFLFWATASETDNAYFEVLRSNDGENFESLGLIETKGSVNKTAAYNFIDKSPFKGISYYLLKQVDKDGNYTTSEVIALKYERFDDADAKLSVYPNPVSLMDFELLGENWNPNGLLHFKIADIIGNIYKNDKLEIDNNGYIQNRIFLPNNLANGVYILFASDGINQKSVKIFVLN